jgi:hypothetical protein
LDEPNNYQQRTRLSSFDAKIVCQGIEPIPQIFDSSSMLSNSIDIQRHQTQQANFNQWIKESSTISKPFWR